MSADFDSEEAAAAVVRAMIPAAVADKMKRQRFGARAMAVLAAHLMTAFRAGIRHQVELTMEGRRELGRVEMDDDGIWAALVNAGDARIRDAAARRESLSPAGMDFVGGDDPGLDVVIELGAALDVARKRIAELEADLAALTGPAK